jgi:ATP-binding protein involved in chromosome partitioning
VPFLGEVPLLAAVRESGDAGLPVVLAAPGSEAAVAFREIAAKVWTATHQPPRSWRR